MAARDDMKLPKGKTCIDCRNFSYCRNLVGAEATWNQCDWAPSRFSPLPSQTIAVAPEDAL